MPVNQVLDTLKRSLMLGLGAGIIAVLIGGMVTGLTAGLGAWSAAVGGLLALVLAIYLGKMSKFDSATLFEFVIALAAIATVVSVLAIFLPAVAGYILTFGGFTLSSLLWTFIYLMGAEVLLNKFGL